MRYNTERDAQAVRRSLLTTANAIRRSRTLEEQRAIARRGEHPFRGTWWPKWIEWKPTDPVASIMTRWSGARARFYGAIGGQSRSAVKVQASRANGRRHRARTL